MTRDHDEVVKRPERVVILDADDPMTEIHGRFVWMEEHERVLEEARRQAFADGYDAARRELAAQPQNVHLRVSRRRSPMRKPLLVLAMVAVVAFVLAVPVLVLAG